MLVARTKLATDLLQWWRKMLQIGDSAGAYSPIELACSEIASEATFGSTRTFHLESYDTNPNSQLNKPHPIQHNMAVPFQISKSTLRVQGEVIR